MADLTCIQLENEAFEGRNNAYLLATDSSLGIIDTGISYDDTASEFRSALASRGYEVTDIDDIVLTHHHPDHTGLVGQLQAESGATVYAHAADQSLLAQDSATLDAYRTSHRKAFDRWGMPPEKQETLLAYLDEHDDVRGDPIDVTPIEDGTDLEIGGETLHTHHTPGHALGLCCFERDDTNEAFVGDAVLPVYTPNVGGADIRVEHSLEQYLDGIRRIAHRDYDRLWPGHRDPIDDPVGRIETIIDHHCHRTDRIVTFLREHGPADAWTVSAHLFGDLEDIHVLHGPGEAAAHLEHLEDRDLLTCSDGQYSLVESEIRVRDVIPPLSV